MNATRQHCWAKPAVVPVANQQWRAGIALRSVGSRRRVQARVAESSCWFAIRKRHWRSQRHPRSSQWSFVVCVTLKGDLLDDTSGPGTFLARRENSLPEPGPLPCPVRRRMAGRCPGTPRPLRLRGVRDRRVDAARTDADVRHHPKGAVPLRWSHILLST